jgi:hypothetical protein
MLFFCVVFKDFAIALKFAFRNSRALLKMVQPHHHPSRRIYQNRYVWPLPLPPRIKAATVVITVPKPKPVGGCSRSFSKGSTIHKCISYFIQDLFSRPQRFTHEISLCIIKLEICTLPGKECMQALVVAFL